MPEPHLTHPLKKAFFCNALHMTSRGVSKKLREEEREFIGRTRLRIGNGNVATLLKQFVDNRGNYLFFDEDKWFKKAGRSPPEDLVLYAPIAKASHMGTSGAVKKGLSNMAKIIRQLKQLGHGVRIQEFGIPEHNNFIRLA
ncbi:MAG: hypothetical protein Q7K42_05040, partial [Candidatus Diapherotrites archaeon]|nr:hypothetical protein [Candidatus Diapherotrites archaeon]